MKASAVFLPFLAAVAVAQTEPENGNPPIDSIEAPAQPGRQPANAVPDAAAPVLDAPDNTPDQADEADEDADKEVDAPPTEDSAGKPSDLDAPDNTPDQADEADEDADKEVDAPPTEDSAGKPSNDRGDSNKSEEDNKDGDSEDSNNRNRNGGNRGGGFGGRIQCFRMLGLEKLAELGEDEERLKIIADNDEERIERLKEKAAKAAEDLKELQSDKELVETCDKILAQVRRDRQCFEMSRLQRLTKLVSDEEALTQRTNGDEERAEKLKSKAAEGETRLKELEGDAELVEYCNDMEIRAKCGKIELFEKFISRASDKDFLEQRFGDREESRDQFKSRAVRLQGRLKALTEEEGLLETCAKITENPDFAKGALKATQDSIGGTDGIDGVEGSAVPGSMPSTATMFSIVALLIASVLIL